ncbi:MAG TPA: SPOR domain-containing protein [Usitatibacter sp.]|nr:SPOR domain-containing protein [Usitatibacter sp.]
MSRFLFFLLVLAILALGAHLWLAAQVEKADFSARERNRDEVRIVGVTPPAIAARRSEDSRKTVASLAGAACVEFSGIAAADAFRAREAFAALQLGARMTERRIEEITRYWVFMPAVRDRRAAETRMAEIRRQGVADLSIRPDNAISLGVFSTEEAARRFLASLEAKGIRGAEQGPFAKDLREMVMLVREPDSELLARLTLLQRDFPNAQLRAVPCPPQ